MISPDIKQVQSREERDWAFQIRYEVFVKEQNIYARLERDEYDEVSCHVLAFLDGKAVGCGRVFINGTTAQIGKVAVLKGYRSRGVGSAVCRTLIDISVASEVSEITLQSQLSAIGFYQTLGFEQCGAVFHIAGIDYIRMAKVPHPAIN